MSMTQLKQLRQSVKLSKLLNLLSSKHLLHIFSPKLSLLRETDYLTRPKNQGTIIISGKVSK